MVLRVGELGEAMIVSHRMGSVPGEWVRGLANAKLVDHCFVQQRARATYSLIRSCITIHGSLQPNVEAELGLHVCITFAITHPLVSKKHRASL